MQNTSQTYKDLLAAGARKQVRALISNPNGSNSSTYAENKIVSAKTTASMFGDKSATIGGCIVKKLNLVLLNPGTIPRMAMIRMQFRLTDGSTSSTWYPKGTYFIDTRDLDAYGVLTINAYDPMLKAERPFAQPDRDQGNWPRSDITIINQIASRIGVTVDSRTTAIITNNYQIPYPGIVLEDGTQKTGDGAYTCRELLGYIGSMYGGNWIITDENKLRLIVLGDIPAGGTNLLVDQVGDYITIGGYRIIVSG